MEIQKKKFVYSLIIPGLFVLLIWVVHLLNTTLELDLVWLGIFPRRAEGLPGILTSPLIHGNWNHLINNSIPILVLGAGIFYFYSDLAGKVLLLTYLFTGIWVWAAGRPAWHIGASGLIYGMASFLFFSGIIRRYVPLMAISLLVIFLYGGMVWGIFPLESGISWESHLLGAVAGWILAIYFRKEGPQRPVYEWELEEEEKEFDEAYWDQVLDEQLEKKMKKKRKRNFWREFFGDPFEPKKGE